MNKKYGFVRIGTMVPKLKVGDTSFNATEIIKVFKEAVSKGVEIISTPELAITSYTAADLFLTDTLINNALEALKTILDSTKGINSILIVGMPIKHKNALYNTAVVIQNGEILGIVPKTFIPNYGEFYELRWFNSSLSLTDDKINIFGKTVPFKTDIIFEDVNVNEIKFSIEICEDLWAVDSPSTRHMLNGSNIIFNLSSSNEIVGKDDYRKLIVSATSGKGICAYVYSSSGVNESTSDLVFSGRSIIASNGTILKQNETFSFESNFIYEDIDVFKLSNLRLRNKSYMMNTKKSDYEVVSFELKENKNKLERHYDKYPFVPSNEEKRRERCEEILNIQACALAKRLMHIGTSKTILGVSGGLDSTLAFLVIMRAYKILGVSNDNLIAITMPGFGTTGRTYNNSLELIKAYGATLKEISIKEACTVHLKDIEHDLDNHDVTYENAQARERTQILMDMANKMGGIVVGTGDLSELALGWCTYNGDHMSMYGVNASVPKTLVRYLVEYETIITDNKKAKSVLEDILATPISPELLPPSKSGKILQQTESLIGPYVLHDFFLYHYLRYGASVEKIYFIACNTFENDYSKEEIKKWLTVFIKKFIINQYKRDCVPDAPKVGSIALSPRGDLRLPSDTSLGDFLKEIDKLG